MTRQDFTVRFPDLDSVPQGDEYFFLDKDGKTEKIRFHDYDRIYQIPGLYEELFYDRYKCNSPEVVCSLLGQHLNGDSENLSVLDVGAGNGMVGELLADMGAETLVGIDIIEEAAKAADRDRPGVYEDYYVTDLTRLPDDIEQNLMERNLNCMTVVAALGFGDIPPVAFARGYNLLSNPAWLAFNIKDEFMCDRDGTGFCTLINRMMDENILEIQAKHRYRHRFCQDGTPLHYYAIVGQKNQDVPEEMLTEFMG